MSRTGAGQHAGVTAKPKRAEASGMLALRLLARRLHFMAGIVVAPFLVVLALTGLVYVFSPQIHDGLYHSQLYVNSSEGKSRPVHEQVRSAIAAHPEGELRAVLTPMDADHTIRVILSVPGLRGSADAAQSRTVFVDPYTNYINGELNTVGTRMPANIWLRDLHSNLHFGESGRIYAELAVSWLPLIVAGGLVLWLAQPRRRKRPTARELLVPSFGGAKDRWMRLRGVHGPLGLWFTAFLLIVALTGLSMSQFTGGRTDRSIDPLTLHSPVLTAAPVPDQPGTDPIGIDRALSIARAEGLSEELLVTPPTEPGDVYTVTKPPPGTFSGTESIAIDPYTATVTERIGWEDYGPLAKVIKVGTAFHTGALFGVANQIIVAVLALGLIVLVVFGYRMWWAKNPYKSRWSVLPPPVWQQLSPPLLAIVLAGIAALTWFMPLLGVSLVLFLVADTAINALRRRRQSDPQSET